MQSFKLKFFRGYNFTGGLISHFRIDFCMGLTTVQRECAACDVCPAFVCFSFFSVRLSFSLSVSNFTQKLLIESLPETHWMHCHIELVLIHTHTAEMYTSILTLASEGLQRKTVFITFISQHLSSSSIKSLS